MPQISEDDFFAKNPEYRVWLSEKEKKAFGDLSDADARSYFKKFVKKWNAGELKEKFYKGITYSELPTHARTTHTWGFAKKQKVRSLSCSHARSQLTPSAQPSPSPQAVREMHVPHAADVLGDRVDEGQDFLRHAERNPPRRQAAPGQGDAPLTVQLL